jgi:hypothetical protein
MAQKQPVMAINHPGQGLGVRGLPVGTSRRRGIESYSEQVVLLEADRQRSTHGISFKSNIITLALDSTLTLTILPVV